MKQTVKNNLLLACFIILKMVLQYRMIASGYELHRDEFLHLDQAHHLAWGFTSVPPVTSWISSLIYWMGNDVFWVKFFPALFGALTILLVWKSIEALEGGLFARILGASAVLCSVYLRINTLYQPNSLDILCWTFLFYCVIRFICSGKSIWLYWFAFGFAIGFLNKYNIIFLLAGLLPALLLTGHRSVFKNKSFYYAIGLIVLMILPNLIWQFRHDFPVAQHMKELSSSQLVHVGRISIIVEQVVFFIPSLFVILFSFIGMIFYKPFNRFRIIGLAYLFTMALFIFLKGKAYYTLGLYPVLFAFGSVYIERVTANRWRPVFRPGAVAFIWVAGIFYVPVICPVYFPEEIQADSRIVRLYRDTGQLSWEDGKEHSLPQDYADMVGWKDLTLLVESVWNKLPVAERKYTLILCDNYGEAGAINYYSGNRLSAVCLSSDYINWFPEMEIRSVILVQKKGENVPDDVRLLFVSVDRAGTLEHRFARESGTSVSLLHQAHIPFNRSQFLSMALLER